MAGLKYQNIIRGIGYAELVFGSGFLIMSVPYLVGFSFSSEPRTDFEHTIGTPLGLEGWLYWVVFVLALIVSYGMWLSCRLVKATQDDTLVMQARQFAFIWKVYIALGICICLISLINEMDPGTLVVLFSLLLPKFVFVSMYINELDEQINNGNGQAKLEEIK